MKKLSDMWFMDPKERANMFTCKEENGCYRIMDRLKPTKIGSFGEWIVMITVSSGFFFLTLMPWAYMSGDLLNYERYLGED
eukprot:g20777.t1